MRIEKKGSMQKQAACIVLPKRFLAGPVADLSSEEVPKLIYIEKTGKLVDKGWCNCLDYRIENVVARTRSATVGLVYIILKEGYIY
jgi:hypothetical protein